MLSDAYQVWLRKTATMLAVFACLLIGTIGGDALALCVGEDHIAVELSAACTNAHALAGISSTPDENCVDAALLSSARVERLAGSAQDVGGKHVLPITTSAPRAPTPQTASATGWPRAQVGTNPALKHHRTVVLLN
ncbi:MAG: hypothetical protein ACM31D_15135 [Bacteroidota bacterium]